MQNTSVVACKSCGNTFSGKYCNNCGEKVYDEHDKSIKHLVEEIFHFFTHFESKFLKTIKLVVFRTGYLSLKYCQGIRKPFFKPVSLFFVCVILYLLFPVFKGLNMQFDTYTNSRYDYTPFTQPILKKKIENHSITRQDVAKQYNEKSPKFAKILLLLFLPLTALALSSLFLKRKRMFFDHFILSTELNTFFVFIVFLVLPMVVYLVMKLWPGTSVLFMDDGIFFKIVLVFCWFVFSLAMKRFYNEKWGWILLKSLVFITLYMFVIRFIYNVILFYLVMLFVH